MGGKKEMLTVETIRKVRLALAKGESQRSVAKKYRMSRNTVKKVVTGGETESKYSRRELKYPVLGPYLERLREILTQEFDLPVKGRRTGKKIYEALQQEGYDGGYDAIRRYIKAWKEENHRQSAGAYVPLTFARGEAFQFD
jgi:transposase